MVFSRKRIEQALTGKGFQKDNRDHKFFFYHTDEGFKTDIRTKISHGRGSQDISRGLFSRMAQQCGLQTIEFNNLVECTLSQLQYERKLRDKKLI